MLISFIKSESSDFENVKKIRKEVFIAEQGAVSDEEFDKYDNAKDTVFALIYDKKTPVATGRIAKYENKFKIGRIAVIKSQRGKGLGAVLVNALCKKANEMGAQEIYIDSQLHAVSFYEKLGFKAVSDDVIIDRGLRHISMRKG